MRDEAVQPEDATSVTAFEDIAMNNLSMSDSSLVLVGEREEKVLQGTDPVDLAAPKEMAKVSKTVPRDLLNEVARSNNFSIVSAMETNDGFLVLKMVVLRILRMPKNCAPQLACQRPPSSTCTTRSRRLVEWSSSERLIPQW